MATQILIQVTVRTATVADIPAIDQLIEPYVEAGKLLHRTYDEFERLLDTLFVAEIDGKLVGCAALEIYSHKLAEVRSLAVSAEAQGLGIGKLLVQACVNLAREKDIFEVMAITSSEAFFQSCGFDFTLPGERKAVFLQLKEKYE